jgi:hypothetical protein
MQKENSAPQRTHKNRRITIGSLATRGDHGFWYIAGMPGQYTRNALGEFCIYAPGSPEDGQVYAREET